MKKKITNEIDTKERIIKAAIEEFSVNGLKGSRVENITKKAGVNKAMLFYYFGSKQSLYEMIVEKTVKTLLGNIAGFLHPDLTIEKFIDEFPSLYIDVLAENKGFINMVIIDLLQNPDFISNIIRKLFKEKFGDGPPPFVGIISKWHKQNDLIEEDPFHFMMNVLSLVIFPFIAKPIPEAIFNKTVEETKEYFEYRKKSIKNLLKRGLLI